VQAGAFAAREDALRHVRVLEHAGYAPVVAEVGAENGRVWHVVRIEGFAKPEEARAVAVELERATGIKALAMTGATERVVPAATTQAPADGLRYSVQVASFREAERAGETMAGLAAKGFGPCSVRVYDGKGNLWHVVQIGDYASHAEALEAGQSFTEREGSPHMIKALDAAFLAERKDCPRP